MPILNRMLFTCCLVNVCLEIEQMMIRRMHIDTQANLPLGLEEFLQANVSRPVETSAQTTNPASG